MYASVLLLEFYQNIQLESGTDLANVNNSSCNPVLTSSRHTSYEPCSAVISRLS